MIRFFVPASGTCQVCNNWYVTRLRLLARLSDSWRTKCRDAPLKNAEHTFFKLSEAVVAVFDALDTISRGMPGKSGHPYPLACTFAKRADGKRIGHVSQQCLFASFCG